MTVSLSAHVGFSHSHTEKQVLAFGPHFYELTSHTDF